MKTDSKPNSRREETVENRVIAAWIYQQSTIKAMPLAEYFNRRRKLLRIPPPDSEEEIE